AAIGYLKEAGRGETADAGALFNGLGAIYIEQDHVVEAREALDRAVEIFERTPDTTPWDRVKVLRTRAALYERQGGWRQAELDFATALCIADRESRVEAAALRPLLVTLSAGDKLGRNEILAFIGAGGMGVRNHLPGCGAGGRSAGLV
ncbi:MAG: tetratricopeptide repeat protein, partial [Acidobacteriaceae bacterium]|nr:tetratricopeptide repeat protein [Acidobacteriaceae bacterium]